jgi:hypothetical protein
VKGIQKRIREVLIGGHGRTDMGWWEHMIMLVPPFIQSYILI